jgi:ATP-dependent exoDNAse (exonuclease V) beta subunit
MIDRRQRKNPSAMNERIDPLVTRDATARAEALDVARSWLVRAPAGSGKTELLIQRFLALLAIVERPEAIVATTFTRKAAAEMRDRVVSALVDAQGSDATRHTSGHDALTHRLARAALGHDRKMGWRLLEQPARLRIVTIDALAAGLARQAPLATGLGALPGFVDDGQALYREAARAALAAASATDAQWQTFLAWLDNNAETATRLVASMLAARDRWPAGLFVRNADELRREVETVLEREVRDALETVLARMPAALADGLPVLARIAAGSFATGGSPPAHAWAVERVAAARALPDVGSRDAWCALADWVLTNQGSFRRSVTVREGFAPSGNGSDAFERVQQKAAFARWLTDAAGVPGLADAWHRVRSLPPARFADDAWAFVASAMHVLHDAADALVDVFGKRGQADFAEATLRALLALGSDEDPTDLLLAIDYRLSHLLVDEFQDTSRAQLALITRLTAGWEPGDGRTLFAVGDPMQSIYRFRQAEVRLFLQAQAEGLVGRVPVGVVELAQNFRSQRNVVAWVNDVFARVLPAVSDTTRGEAAFAAAYAAAARPPDMGPTLDLVGSRDEEAARVVARIREARAAGHTDIAVLVRARSHAQALLPALRAAGIEFSAVDLEGLHDRLATRDLLSLARAIAQPADRLAWLSVLRAPWCGLDLAELLQVAQASIGRCVVDAIADPDAMQHLSPQTTFRVSRLLAAVEPALAARGRARFALRVRAAWLALGGPACMRSALDRAGADRVFALLAEHERGGDLPDHDALLAMAAMLFGEPGNSASAGVQLMTLHRAKGLQFDVVILPGLDLETGSGDPPLLRWKVREHDGAPTLVLAPMRARAGARTAHDPIYAWLSALDTAEEAAELGRLLYVGATRARQRLHLAAVAAVDTDAGDWKRPARGTALERLWDALDNRMPPITDASSDGTATIAAASHGDLLRLPVDWRLPPEPDRLPVPVSAAPRIEAPVFDWADAVSAAIGTVSHRLLAQIASEGLAEWDERRLQRERERIAADLGSEGVETDLRDRAAQRVASVIARTLRDERGRWLFDASHADPRSEWALAGVDDGRIVHVVVDRSFVAAGHRYIVDFKTGSHLGGDANTFLREEFERYRPQLERYARIVGALEALPVRIALYHPLVEGGWQEHSYPAVG